MTKTHLKDAVKLDGGNFAQWRIGMKIILKMRGNGGLFQDDTRPYIPQKYDTLTVTNPPGGSTDSLVYNLEDKVVIEAITLRDEME